MLSVQGGKRKGSIAIYLEPWHADVFDFLDLRKNSGKEDLRCRDLFTALWVPDLFIRRVEQDGAWSLFDPDKARGLPDCYGEEFDELYEKYEAIPGLASRVVRAKAVWSAMLTAQVEGGTPYVLYKDAVNRKSNQKHLGTIKSSNLCAGEAKLLGCVGESRGRRRDRWMTQHQSLILHCLACTSAWPLTCLAE